MEQRRLRLGDTLDDYCPRERRVTNHAIVAMVEDDIKQTRCTTCDAEHPYKGARVPRRRKKEAPDALFKEVLAGMPDPEATPVLTVPVAVVKVAQPAEIEPDEDADRYQPVAAVAPAQPRDQAPVEPAEVAAAPDEASTTEDGPPAGESSGPSEDWPMHRPLIRAQLPRIEGQKEERRPTEFTIRQPGGRSNFRGGDARAKFRGHGGHGPSGNGNGNGNRAHGGPRFSGGRPSGPGRGPSGPGRGPGGPGRGPSAGFRGGPPRQGGGKKRSR